jgi:hypothetical protein
MRSRSQPPPTTTRRRTWCLPARTPAAPAPLFATQRDLVVLSLLLRPERG